MWMCFFKHIHILCECVSLCLFYKNKIYKNMIDQQWHHSNGYGYEMYINVRNIDWMHGWQ